MAKLIDTHAHLFWESYQQDFDLVVKRAVEAGLDTIINIGTDLDTSQKAINLRSNKIHFFSSIGIHPHEAHKYYLHPNVSIHQDITKMEELFKTNISNHLSNKVITVGECGLDYVFKNNPDFIPSSLTSDQLKKLQQQLFQAQIEFSKKLDLPLVIHCRDAWIDIFDTLEGTKGLFHTFTGTAQDAKKALALGYFLSFSAIITYPKNEYLREIIKSTPLDKILTETDCPFLPPQSKRGQRNEPSSVKEIVELIAELKGLSFDEVTQQIYQNAVTLFRLTIKD